MKLTSIILALRIIGAFLAASSLFGLIMFWSTTHPAAAGIPLTLLLLSLTSVARIKKYPWLLIIAVFLVIFSYTLAGIPFLNVHIDAVARVLHFIEFLLVCVFVLYALAQIWRDHSREKSNNAG
jgi:hypothetical protein